MHTVPFQTQQSIMRDLRWTKCQWTGLFTSNSDFSIYIQPIGQNYIQSSNFPMPSRGSSDEAPVILNFGTRGR